MALRAETVKLTGINILSGQNNQHATNESYETVALDEKQYCITEQIMVSSHCVFFTREKQKTRQKLVDIQEVSPQKHTSKRG